MLQKPYLLLDAGGTVVFPNEDILIQLASKNGISLTHQQLYYGYYKIIRGLDLQDTVPQDPWPDGYTRNLLNTLGVYGPDADRLAMDASDYHVKTSLWTFTFPWVYDALSELKDSGYRMSILSNSDGRTKKIMGELGLSRYFEHIFDSRDLECEKPNREIFDKVRNELDVASSNILYIGDIYKVDVLGANQAGMGGIHIDPFRLYRDLPGVHIDNVTQLGDWMSAFVKDPDEFVPKLFPFSHTDRGKLPKVKANTSDAKLSFSKGREVISNSF